MSSIGRTAIAIPATEAHHARLRQRSGTLSALIETTKPGITRLVAFTALTGYALVSLPLTQPDTREIARALAAAIGTALAAAGANALNMWLESHLDRRMPRTLRRPIPSDRLSPRAVARWGTTLVLAGVGLLLLVTGPAPALLALASAALYLFFYTPLKTRTPWCTVVGALPGALPTLIGAAAASAKPGAQVMLEPAGLALFALLAVWQLPHFYALAWMYRHDYAAAGMRMITVTDPTGRDMRRATLATTLLLLPASIAPALASPLLGWPYALIAAAASIAFFILTIRLARAPSDRAARLVFFASITHLPLLLIAAITEALLRSLVL